MNVRALSTISTTSSRSCTAAVVISRAAIGVARLLVRDRNRGIASVFAGM